MDLASLRAAQAPAPAVPDAVMAAPVIPGFGSLASFEALQRMAKLFSASALVPQAYRSGESGVANAAIALDMAVRMGANPLMVFQNLYIVQGKPAWSSQFLIATFNQSGKYSSLRFEFEGQPGTDGYGCRAVATELATGDKLEGTLITMGMARKEGWLNKAGSKWLTMPEQMLRYRAAAFFIRAIAPEIAMGLRSVEEEREILEAKSSPRQVATVEQLRAAEASAPAPELPAAPAPAQPEHKRRGRPKKEPAPAQQPAQEAPIQQAEPEPQQPDEATEQSGYTAPLYAESGNAPMEEVPMDEDTSGGMDAANKALLAGCKAEGVSMADMVGCYRKSTGCGYADAVYDLGTNEEAFQRTAAQVKQSPGMFAGYANEEDF